MKQHKRPDLAELNASRLHDLTGQTFNALTVLYRAENQGVKVMWHCRCACGKELDVWAYLLKEGQKGQKSCGCMTKKILHDYRVTHGESDTRLYNVWHGIRQRCNNPKDKGYARYGGRGIKMCKEWDSYEVFKKWALESGYDENAASKKCTIDRIDNEKGYSPANCRWVSAKEQANNRRSNHWITYRGETRTITEWESITGISRQSIIWRLKKGWSEDRALSEPVRKVNRR